MNQLLVENVHMISHRSFVPSCFCFTSQRCSCAGFRGLFFILSSDAKNSLAFVDLPGFDQVSIRDDDMKAIDIDAKDVTHDLNLRWRRKLFSNRHFVQKKIRSGSKLSSMSTMEAEQTPATL